MKSSEILSNNQTISLTESKKDYCDACDSVIIKRPHVCPGTEKLSEVSRDPQEVDAADKAISKIVDQKENVDEYTSEEIAQLQKLSKITGRSHKLWNSRNYFRRPVGKIIDRIVMYAREKQRDSGQMPDFTGRATTAKDMANQIAVQTDGRYYHWRGTTWTSSRTGRRYRDASDFVSYKNKEAFEDAWEWVQSKGKQVHYRDNFNNLNTAIQLGRFIVEPASVTRNAFGDNPETQYRLSVRSAKSLDQWSRQREDITDQQAAALRDIAATKHANADQMIRAIMNILKGEQDLKKVIDNSKKIDPRDKTKLDQIIASAGDFRELSEDYSKTLSENLRDWFGKGKEGGAGGGGWDRYNTKGERIGKCGDRKPGEGKPKCLSKSKAASLRASGGKKAIANAVKRKKAQDKNPNRRGKAKNVKNVAESNMFGYETVDIWTSNFTAHGQDMRYMFDLPDNSTVTFGELPYTVQVEIERQIGGQVGDGEQLIIKQHPARGLDHDRVTVLVPELEELDEETMAQAAKNPTGPKFGGYYGATQRGAPRPGQSFGGAAESKTNNKNFITQQLPLRWNDLPDHLSTHERAEMFEQWVLDGSLSENNIKKLSEVAPPDQEDWIKKNKERFIKQYGKKKGTEVLYATAWKRSKTDEAANWGPHEGHVSKNPIGIPENQESDLEKKLERAKARMNAYTTKASLRDKVKTRKEISDLKKQLGKKD